MSTTMRAHLALNIVSPRKPSLADTPRPDGTPWVINRIPQISESEKAKIRKLCKFA